MISFINFLKKYSTIPNQFLDDFYKIFSHVKMTNNEINIDLDNVIKWLKIKKQSAKDTLTKSYKKDIDYQIKKVIKKKGKGGQKKEIIMITVQCFKKI
jgi:hypothetical protein